MSDTLVMPTPDDLDACLKTPATVVETAVGPVEYAERGQGPVLLSVHGGPGGYDQGLLLGELFRCNGFRIVAVSRPGYLGTPLSSGASPAAQADALDAFVTAMGLDAVHVIGASAGGPASYLLAARHPRRVKALITVDAVCRSYRPNSSELVQKMFITPLGLRLTAFLVDHFPRTALRGLLQEESTLEGRELDERVAHILADPAKHALVTAMVHSFADRFPERQAGVLNDLAITRDLGDLPLQAIRCPTLIVHGEADNDVSPDHASYAAGAIAGARLEWIRAGSHMGFWLADEAAAIQRLAVQWLRAIGEA